MSAGSIMPHFHPAPIATSEITLEDLTITSDYESVAYMLTATGDIWIDDDVGTGLVDSGDDWLTPQVGMAGYEVRATFVSGEISTGVSSATGVWLPLSVDQKWRCKAAGPTHPNRSLNLTIEIRPVGGAVADTCTVTMTDQFLG